jgi:hypothetical protein
LLLLSELDGRDYGETFAHVAHMTTVRNLLVVAFVQEWSISQLNVNNVFLNGELCEVIYMWPPHRYPVPEYGLSSSLLSLWP